MERLKYTLKLPEIPEGRDGVDSVLGLVNQVLLKHPAVSQRSAKLLTPDRVKIDALENIQSIEEQDKPLKGLQLNQALELAGVPEDFLKSKVYTATNTHPYYFNIAQKEAVVYIERRYLDGLSLKRPLRYEWAMNLGLVLIQASFESLIQAANLPNRLREKVKPTFVRKLENDLFADILKQTKFKTAKEDLEVARDALEEVMEANEGPKKARFLRYGARIFLVGPNKTIIQNEYGLGQTFDLSVYCYLASAFMQEFLDLIQTKYMVSHRKVPGEVFRRADLSQTTLAKVSLLDRNELMGIYFNSDLPVILLDKDLSNF